MRVNLVNSVRFGAFGHWEGGYIKQSQPNRRGKGKKVPVTIVKPESEEQIAAFGKYRAAREAYDAVKNDANVDPKEKDRLKRDMEIADKAYLKILGF